MATADVVVLPQLLNPAVSRYFRQSPPPTDAGPWAETVELPTSKEISRLPAVDRQTGEELRIEGNKVIGPWSSKDAYLGNHYRFLREEAVRPLREAVAQLKITPSADESTFNRAIGIYEKVHIIGLKTSTRGIAIGITFSTKRAGKKIRWEQANRLLSGSLIALTPSADMFKTKTLVATIAARPLEGLQFNPPELEIFVRGAAEIDIDPAVEWIMCEARSSFFEAERHTMLALQKLMCEPKFPMVEQLVNVDTAIGAPAYLQGNLTLNLCAIAAPGHNLDSVNIHEDWSQSIKSELDPSQLAALQRILTKSLAIVQGPPGTGKTFVSVKALQIMLANRSDNDPPIIVTAQTNHALDQLLRHIAQFEPDFARVGGRSRDRGVIAARELYELRNAAGKITLPGCQGPEARKNMKLIEKKIEALLRPLKADKQTLDPDILQKRSLLSEDQVKTLKDGANRWIQAGLRNPEESRSPFTLWLDKALVKVPSKPEPEDYGFEYEEAEVEFEQLQDIEAENAVKEEEFDDSLHGSVFTLADNFTCSKAANMSDKEVEKLLKKEQDLWKIKETMRPSVYNYLQRRLKEALRDLLRVEAKQYDEAARQARIGNWEKDEVILRGQKVIGLTTTGLSKYRALIASLGCKIILVEEAAETLEAPVIAACIPTLEHLILVGDHKQLRPHCKVQEHERKPLYYNISMFERMVDNNMGMETLREQRRMTPEIRRLLIPIYGNAITDHPSVKDPSHRSDVPGMGGINSYFFTHEWPERRNDKMSCINTDEADMILGFVEHLVHNGMQSRHITILTFYNGQRERIGQLLRKSKVVKGMPFHLVTVDSYQGEENRVVILSLVRSNKTKSIGFLANDNRVCVALSRAQCGFYLFGNAMLLGRFKTWNKVIGIIAGGGNAEDIPAIEPKRFHEVLPIRCMRHKRTVNITEPSDWEKLAGGCDMPCRKELNCGHHCPLLCHPFSHDHVVCTQPCTQILLCGHKCTQECSQACLCQQCSKSDQQQNDSPAIREVSSGRSSSTASWQSFAKHEPIRYAQTIASNAFNNALDREREGEMHHTQTRLEAGSPLKEELLIDFGEDDPQQMGRSKTKVNGSVNGRLQTSMCNVSLLD